MSANIQTVLNTVNSYLYNGHGRGLFEPAQMEATRKSNCFGRLAVVGSALQEEMPEADIFLLFAKHHGMECASASGRNIRWLAHAEMVVLPVKNSLDGGSLIDTVPFKDTDPILRSVDELLWKPGDSVAFHPARDARKRHMPEAELERRYGPSDIRALHHVFEVHPFAQGLIEYQQTVDPDALYAPSDYLAVYDSAQVAARTVGESDEASFVPA